MLECAYCGFATSNRQTFRRHLTFKHDADCRYEKGLSGRFYDVIVKLHGEELASRVAVLRNGQRHVRRRKFEKKAVDRVTVLPAERTSAVPMVSAATSHQLLQVAVSSAAVSPVKTSATVSSVRAEPCYQAAGNASPAGSMYDFTSGVNTSIDFGCEELLETMGPDGAVPLPDLTW